MELIRIDFICIVLPTYSMSFHHTKTLSSIFVDSQTTAAITEMAGFLLIPFVAVFAFVVFIFYRQNREAQVRKQKTDLELKALRAQMNPHFMFNCLNSIYHSIQQHKNEEAGIYLQKFSYLTRRILENSNKRWIALSEDLELLRSYMDLERQRTEERFDYTIHVDPTLDVENTSVLMLIIQPFIENSIIHGFGQDNRKGRIHLELWQADTKLHYSLSDNGAPSDDRPDPLHSMKKQSMGLSLVRDQLRAIELTERSKADFTMEDLLGENGEYLGKRVHLYIPLLTLH